MDALHTPGPWTVEPEHEGEQATYVHKNGQTIADCDHGYRASEQEANARLIAAAPDLLAALYEIAQGGNQVRKDWPAHKAIDRETMCDIARAAIAKTMVAK